MSWIKLCQSQLYCARIEVTRFLFVVGRMVVTIFDTENVSSNFFCPCCKVRNNFSIRSIAFEPSSHFLAIGRDNGIVSILSAEDGWIPCHQINLGSSALSRVTRLLLLVPARYFAFTTKNTWTYFVNASDWSSIPLKQRQAD